MKAELDNVTYSSEFDFLAAGAVPYMIQLDADEMSGTTCQMDVYTRETDTDGWWFIGGVGTDAVNHSAQFPLERLRHVRVVITTTGVPPVGAIGFAT